MDVCTWSHAGWVFGHWIGVWVWDWVALLELFLLLLLLLFGSVLLGLGVAELEHFEGEEGHGVVGREGLE